MAPRDFRSRLSKRAARANIFLPPELAAALTAYYDLLSRWNQKINLTSLEDPDQAIDRLLLEPLVAVRCLSPEPLTVMDVGSGGGSPAIPMKLAAPANRLIMVEVKARKSAFLGEAVRTLALENAQVENARFEELLARPELHEVFDVVTVRAVRIEPRVLTTLQAFVRPGGQVLLFRGPTGPDTPTGVVPPLEFASTYPLIEATQSRLTVLMKRAVGPVGVGVPRGTLPAR